MANGFAPCWFEGQQNAGLGVYIATGLINGILVNGSVVYVPAKSTTQIWVTSDGVVSFGSSVPGGAYAIATVVSGTIIVGGNQPPSLLSPIGKWGGLSTEDGILSITDIRNLN